MFSLESVVLYGLDIVTGPYVHCASPHSPHEPSTPSPYHVPLPSSGPTTTTTTMNTTGYVLGEASNHSLFTTATTTGMAEAGGPSTNTNTGMASWSRRMGVGGMAVYSSAPGATTTTTNSHHHHWTSLPTSRVGFRPDSLEVWPDTTQWLVSPSHDTEEGEKGKAQAPPFKGNRCDLADNPPSTTDPGARAVAAGGGGGSSEDLMTMFDSAAADSLTEALSNAAVKPLPQFVLLPSSASARLPPNAAAGTSMATTMTTTEEDENKEVNDDDNDVNDDDDSAAAAAALGLELRGKEGGHSGAPGGLHPVTTGHPPPLMDADARMEIGTTTASAPQVSEAKKKKNNSCLRGALCTASVAASATTRPSATTALRLSGSATDRQPAGPPAGARLQWSPSSSSPYHDSTSATNLRGGGAAATTTSAVGTAVGPSLRGHPPLAALGDVFVPRPEFCRRVLWMYTAESGLLSLYYPEEIPGEHYPRKTLRYTLSFNFRVPQGLLTVGESLHHTLIQPYSVILTNVAGELRTAELKCRYMFHRLTEETIAAHHQQPHFGGSSSIRQSVPSASSPSSLPGGSGLTTAPFIPPPCSTSGSPTSAQVVFPGHPAPAGHGSAATTTAPGRTAPVPTASSLSSFPPLPLPTAVSGGDVSGAMGEGGSPLSPMRVGLPFSAAAAAGGGGGGSGGGNSGRASSFTATVTSMMRLPSELEEAMLTGSGSGTNAHGLSQPPPPPSSHHASPDGSPLETAEDNEVVPAAGSEEQGNAALTARLGDVTGTSAGGQEIIFVIPPPAPAVEGSSAAAPLCLATPAAPAAAPAGAETVEKRSMAHPASTPSLFSMYTMDNASAGGSFIGGVDPSRGGRTSSAFFLQNNNNSSSGGGGGGSVAAAASFTSPPPFSSHWAAASGTDDGGGRGRGGGLHLPPPPPSTSSALMSTCHSFHSTHAASSPHPYSSSSYARHTSSYPHQHPFFAASRSEGDEALNSFVSPDTPHQWTPLPMLIHALYESLREAALEGLRARWSWSFSRWGSGGGLASAVGLMHGGPPAATLPRRNATHEHHHHPHHQQSPNLLTTNTASAIAAAHYQENSSKTSPAKPGSTSTTTMAPGWGTAAAPPPLTGAGASLRSFGMSLSGTTLLGEAGRRRRPSYPPPASSSAHSPAAAGASPHARRVDPSFVGSRTLSNGGALERSAVRISDRLSFHVRHVAPLQRVPTVRLEDIPVRLLPLSVCLANEGMDLLAREVIRLVDGRRRVADLVFSIALHTRARLTRVYEAAVNAAMRFVHTKYAEWGAAVAAAATLNLSVGLHRPSPPTSPVHTNGSGAAASLHTHHHSVPNNSSSASASLHACTPTATPNASSSQITPLPTNTVVTTPTSTPSRQQRGAAQSSISSSSTTAPPAAISSSDVASLTAAANAAAVTAASYAAFFALPRVIVLDVPLHDDDGEEEEEGDHEDVDDDDTVALEEGDADFDAGDIVGGEGVRSAAAAATGVRRRGRPVVVAEAAVPEQREASAAVVVSPAGSDPTITTTTRKRHVQSMGSPVKGLGLGPPPLTLSRGMGREKGAAGDATGGGGGGGSSLERKIRVRVVLPPLAAPSLSQPAANQNQSTPPETSSYLNHPTPCDGSSPPPPHQYQNQHPHGPHHAAAHPHRHSHALYPESPPDPLASHGLGHRSTAGNLQQAAPASYMGGTSTSNGAGHCGLTATPLTTSSSSVSRLPASATTTATTTGAGAGAGAAGVVGSHVSPLLGTSTPRTSPTSAGGGGGALLGISRSAGGIEPEGSDAGMGLSTISLLPPSAATAAAAPVISAGSLNLPHTNTTTASNRSGTTPPPPAPPAARVTWSPTTLPAPSVVFVDLPSTWPRLLEMVKEALVQLEVNHALRRTKPCRPGTTYSTTPAFQEVLRCATHPARREVGRFMAMFERKQKQKQLKKRHRQQQQQQRRRYQALMNQAKQEEQLAQPPPPSPRSASPTAPLDIHSCCLSSSSLLCSPMATAATTQAAAAVVATGTGRLLGAGRQRPLPSHPPVCRSSPARFTIPVERHLCYQVLTDPSPTIWSALLHASSQAEESMLGGGTRGTTRYFLAMAMNPVPVGAASSAPHYPHQSDGARLNHIASIGPDASSTGPRHGAPATSTTTLANTFTAASATASTTMTAAAGVIHYQHASPRSTTPPSVSGVVRPPERMARLQWPPPLADAMGAETTDADTEDDFHDEPLSDLPHTCDSPEDSSLCDLNHNQVNSLREEQEEGQQAMLKTTMIRKRRGQISAAAAGGGGFRDKDKDNNDPSGPPVMHSRRTAEELRRSGSARRTASPQTPAVEEERNASRIPRSSSCPRHRCGAAAGVKRGPRLPPLTEDDIRHATSAAICGLGKFHNATTVTSVQSAMQLLPAFSSMFCSWSRACCEALVLVGLLNGWLREEEPMEEDDEISLNG